PDDPRFVELRDRFLAHYDHCLYVHTRIFEGIPPLLAALEARGLRWGIVTNKAARFTDPLMRSLDPERRAACVVSGDTTPRTKPAPDSLLFAAKALGVAPEECLYIGDDQRDVQAARAAGMRVLAASYGYLSGGDPATWGADGVIGHPMEVVPFLLAA